MSKWKKSHAKLQKALNQEITLRQQILSNLNHQENILLTGDITLKNKLDYEINLLIHKLKMLIKNRGICTRQLFDIISLNSIGTTLDEILDPTKEIEGDTLMLYQKVCILIQKIHEQHLRVKNLFKTIQKDGTLGINNSSIYIKKICEKKEKKPTLITIDYPKGSQVK